MCQPLPLPAVHTKKVGKMAKKKQIEPTDPDEYSKKLFFNEYLRKKGVLSPKLTSKGKLQLEKDAKAAHQTFEKNFPRNPDWPPFPLPEIYDSDNPKLIKDAIEAVERCYRNYIPDMGYNREWLKDATDVAFDVRSAWLHNGLIVEEIPLAENPLWPIKQDFTRLYQWLITLDAEVTRELSEPIVTNNGTGDNKALISKKATTWTFTYQNKEATIDSRLKGLELIECLLTHPDKEYTALELLKEVNQRSAAELAPQKLYQYREIQLMKRAIENMKIQAENENDPETKEELEIHIEKSEKILYNSRNCYGRSRSFTDKHRMAVIRNIKTVVDKIGFEHKGLYNHLNTFLQKGEICKYKPDFNIIWDVF